MTWERTPELEQEIIDALQNGVGLLKWCKQDGRPSRNTVLRWQEDDDFGARCARAREAAGELSAEEQDDIAQMCLTGQVLPDVARVVISAKQWRAAKLAPRKYGEKLTQEIGGIDGKPIETKQVTDDELNRRITELATKTGAGRIAGVTGREAAETGEG